MIDKSIVSLIRQEATAIAQKVANDVYNSKGTQYGVPVTPVHTHNNIDSPALDPKFFLGFPVISSAPTDSPANGTIRLYNSGGTRKIYAFISGTWYSATLT
jgi:hypothetical protein